MALSDERNQAQNISMKGTSIRFVESLEDAQDYWMSLTDAARVTRTSEAMARRWVSSGRLPVKREPAGINQRTRLVRASDVARLRPIIDPTAAITDEIHKLDLLSIPRQQAQLLHEQGKVLELVQSVQQAVKQLAEETRTGLEQGGGHPPAASAALASTPLYPPSNAPPRAPIATGTTRSTGPTGGGPGASDRAPG